MADGASYLVVVTNDTAVAAWAAGSSSSGMVTMRPLVITPAHFPPITDPEQTKRSLKRTFLSGLIHASKPMAADIVRAARAAFDSSPDAVGLHYGDTLLAVRGDAIRSTNEMEMKRDWKPLSEWGKRFVAEVKAEVLAQVHAELRSELRSEGRAMGEVEGRAASILDVLEARGLSRDAWLRQRIAACADAEVLTQWLRRAATATHVDEIFTR